MHPPTSLGILTSRRDAPTRNSPRRIELQSTGVSCSFKMSPLGIRYQLLVLALAAFLPSWTMAGVASSENRQGRWLFERKIYNETSTVVLPQVRYRASSCYVIESSLPPCKSLRRRRDIKIDATPTLPILSTAAPILEEIGNDNALGAVSSHRQVRQHTDGFVVANPLLDPSNDNQDAQYPTYGITPYSEELNRFGRQAVPSPDAAVNATVTVQNATVDNHTNHQNLTALPMKWGWLERLFLKAYTSTYVTTQYSTQWFADPDHMITFSVRGCEPTKLPFEMAKCSEAFTAVKATDNVPVIQAYPTTSSAAVSSSVPPPTPQ